MVASPVVVTVVAGATAVATATDLRTRRVPNWLTFGVAAIGLTMAAAHLDRLNLSGALEGLAVGLLLMLPGHVIGKTGAGDVKLVAALGTLLGPASITVACLCTAIAGGALAVLIAVRRGQLRQAIVSTALLGRTGGTHVADIEDPTRDNRFAYAPAIAVGAVIAAFLG